ncbi:MAG: hypothetical protein ACLFNX_04380 [Spirochaetaceae bacterium]
MLILLTLCSIVGTGTLSAAGGQEAGAAVDDPIEEANRLVEEGRLNEAMLTLEAAVRENPDLIEESEKVMDRIRSQREEYNEEFERLIDNLINSPDQIERTLAIIDRMERLDRFPNERVADQVSEARVIAQLAYDRDRAATIMREAARLIDEERYADAVERYLSGFDLQRERFEEREYGNIFVNSVEESIEEVRGSAEAFIETAPELQGDVTALEDAAESDTIEEIDTLLDNYADVFGRVGTRLESVEEGAAQLAEHDEEVASIDPDDPVDWHIRLIRRFAAGRADVAEPDGITGALETARTRSRFDLARAFAGRADVHIDRGVAAAEERSWERAMEELDVARIQADASVRLAVMGTDAETDDEFEEAAVQLPDSLEGLYADGHVRRQTAISRQTLADIMAEVDAQRVDPADTEDLDMLSEAKAAMAARVSEVRELSAGLQQMIASYRTIDEEALSEDAEAHLTRSERAVSDREGEVIEYEVSTLDRIAGLRFTRFTDGFDRGREDYRSGIDFLEGVDEVVEQVTGVDGEQEEVAVTYRYPDRALEQFLAVQDDVQTLRDEVADALESYRGEDEYVLGEQRIEDRIADTAALLEDIDELAEQIASRITSAQDQIARAEELRDEGDGLVAQTRQAINNLQVERARELWEEARRRYFESLELQQDAAFRDEADELITALGAEIQEARNRRIVEQVRDRIDRADARYEQEDYQRAFELLTEARDLWEQTNVQPNPEIERLLRFVNAALNLENTRTLAETEPLYPVLSGYLNLARRDFNEAQAEVEGDGESPPQQLLARAEENVDNVTAVRPYNWEARILKLRILRLRDSDNFDEVFERRFEEALDRKDDDPQEALTAFETLAAINPDYPGLQDEIVELEIDLGIRPDPVTEAQINESNRLLNQAREVAAGAGEAQRQAAMSILEEAVTLNPDNREAQILLDRLRIQSGGEATVALSSAEEQQLRRAETLFIEDNAAQAYAIVQQLLRDEDNQRYPPLLDLEERIAERLGL